MRTNSNFIYDLKGVYILVKEKDKVVTKKSDTLVLLATLGFVVDLIVGIWFSQYFLYMLFTVIYFLGYFVYCIHIVFKDIKDMWKNEPFGVITTLLAVTFLGIPILFISVTNQNILSDSIKLFYTVAIGIGINYVIDGVFKLIEPEIKNTSAKTSLTKKAAFTKILFNAIYISEYAAFVFLENIQLCFFEPLKQWDLMYKLFEFLFQLANWVKILFLTIVFFVILMSIAFRTQNLIKKELENEMDNQTNILIEKVQTKLTLVSELKSTIEEIKKSNDDVMNELEKIESEFKTELEDLRKLEISL